MVTPRFRIKETAL